MADEVDSTQDTTDEEVANALGVGDGGEQEEQGQEPEEVAFEDLPKATQDEIRKLRRENAALRLKSRAARKQATTATADAGKTAADLDAAKAAGRAEADAEHGIELADARVRAALAGVVSDEQIEEIVEDLNLSRFVGEDNKPDAESIKVLRDKYVALTGGSRRTPKPNIGSNGKAKAPKSNAEQFADTLKQLPGW